MKLSDPESMFRTMRGPNTDLDHYLLKIIVNQKLPKKKRVALIMLIIALQFDVSTSCNEKIKINKMNKRIV